MATNGSRRVQDAGSHAKAQGFAGSGGATPYRPGPLRVFAFAAGVALVAATAVSLVAVLLEPRLDAQERAAREAELLALLEAQPGVRDLLKDPAAGALRADVVDLERGCFDNTVDPAAFSAPLDMAPGTGRALEPAEDTARIGMRPDHAIVYGVANGDDLVLLALPVVGLGYQSRLEGFLILEGDLETVAALTFYAHGETPGMGGRISAPEWPSQWRGKRLRDDEGRLRIGVAGRSSAPDARRYRIDAMTGATFTASGVTALLHFWLGPLGYGPLLENLKEDAPCVDL